MTKKKIQKILAVMFAFIFVLSAFTACGKKDKNEPSVAPTEGTTEPTTEDDFSIPPIEEDGTTKTSDKESETESTKKQDSSTKPTQNSVKPTEKTTKKPSSSAKPTQSATKPTQAPAEASKDVFKTAYFTTSTGEKIKYTSYEYYDSVGMGEPLPEWMVEHTYTAYEEDGKVYIINEDGEVSTCYAMCSKCHSYTNCKCDPYVCAKCGKHNCNRQGNGGPCYGCGKVLKPNECHECPNMPNKTCPHCGKNMKTN